MPREYSKDPLTRFREMTIRHNEICHRWEHMDPSLRLERQKLADEAAQLQAEIFYLRRELMTKEENNG